jgi:hypothetical protein
LSANPLTPEEHILCYLYERDALSPIIALKLDRQRGVAMSLFAQGKVDQRKDGQFYLSDTGKMYAYAAMQKLQEWRTK